jgi:hypothetical protein
MAAAALLLLAGCGDDETVDPNLPPDNYISANTPINAVRRVMATYEARDRVSYLGNLTTDFGFRFSPASDPDLVVVYGDDWDKTFEDLSTRHLYEGFTDGLGTFHPKAVRIDSDFLAASVSPDPNHPDSTRHYQFVDVPLLGIVWELEGDPNEIIGIESDYGFHVVRGDAAALGAGQPSDSLRWYVYRIEDFSTAIAAPARGSASMPGSSYTWGAIRAAYLQ